MAITALRDARRTGSTGGKATQLGSLLRLGLRVPDGFVITAETTANWNKAVREMTLRHFDTLGAPYVAVRSSAVAEDGRGASWAGQFDTFLFVDRANLIDKIEQCIASVSSARSWAYRTTARGSVVPGIAVVVQTMIASDVSGVCFSVHPITQDSNQIVIEAAYGLGEAVVSGEVTPDNYVVTRQSRKIISRSIARQSKMLSFSENKHETTWQATENPDAQKLSDTQILELADVALKLEQHFDHAVDIEWAYYQEQLYILQSRPITTLQ